MSDTVIEDGAYVGNSIVGANVTVKGGAKVGCPHADGADIALIGPGNVIECGDVVAPGAMVYSPEA